MNVVRVSLKRIGHIVTCIVAGHKVAHCSGGTQIRLPQRVDKKPVSLNMIQVADKIIVPMRCGQCVRVGDDRIQTQRINARRPGISSCCTAESPFAVDCRRVAGRLNHLTGHNVFGSEVDHVSVVNRVAIVVPRVQTASAGRANRVGVGLSELKTCCSERINIRSLNGCVGIRKPNHPRTEVIDKNVDNVRLVLGLQLLVSRCAKQAIHSGHKSNKTAPENAANRKFRSVLCCFHRTQKVGIKVEWIEEEN